MTTGGLSYVKLTNWIFTEWWTKYESGLCHWMANFQEIWWNGKSVVFSLMIRTLWRVLCAVSSLLFWQCSFCRNNFNLVVMLEFVKDLAYVINVGAHLNHKSTNWMLPNVETVQSASKSCNAAVPDIMTSAARRRRRRRVSRCERVFRCVSSEAAWLALTLTWGL